MLTVRIVCIGKLSEKHWQLASNEYEKRLRAFIKLEIHELAEQKLPKSPSDGDIARALEKEMQSMEAATPSGSYVIAMCIEGRMLDSEALSAQIAALQVDGVSKITVLIGGSHGIHETLKKRADLQLSMSKMTFPHQFARVMVLEQVYRAMMIQNGNKYHK